jgi:hypothetical protein
MPRLPYPLALFFLFPYCDNKRAKRAVAYPDNIYYILILPDNIKALNISFHIQGKLFITLITLGQSVKANIYLKGSNIAKV